MGDRQRERITLFQSSVTYRDARIAGYDAVVLMEVVEHVDPPRLPALERSVFGAARPTTVVVTTPNVEHNVRYADPRRGRDATRGPPVRVDPAEFTRMGRARRLDDGYTVAFVAVGDGRPRGRAAHPAGRLHQDDRGAQA